MKKYFVLILFSILFTSLSSQNMLKYDIGYSNGVVGIDSLGNISYMGPGDLNNQINNFEIKYRANLIQFINLNFYFLPHISNQFYFGMSYLFPEFKYSVTDTNLVIFPCIVMYGLKTLYQFNENNYGPYIGIGIGVLNNVATGSITGAFGTPGYDLIKSCFDMFIASEYSYSFFSIDMGIKDKIVIDNFVYSINASYLPIKNVFVLTIGIDLGWGSNE